MTSDYIGFAVGGNGGTGSTGTQVMLANFGNPPYSVSSQEIVMLMDMEILNILYQQDIMHYALKT